MRVLSTYPVIIKGKASNFSSLDGTSNKNLVLGFQKWANKYKKAGLVEDGVWGKNTKKAWDSYGSEYEKLASGAANIFNTASQTATASSPKPTNLEKAGMVYDKVKGAWVKAKEIKESGFFDRFKGLFGFGAPTESEQPMSTSTEPAPAQSGMSKGMKIGLAVAGVALVGTVIYFVTKGKGKKNA